MNTEDFAKQLEDITNADLVLLADQQLSKLIKTNGKSFLMSVPAQTTDTDIIFMQLIKRFEEITEELC